MLTEELSIIDPVSPLWNTVRPLLDAALKLEQGPSDMVWHGWHKPQIDAFLRELPDPCTLLVAVWDTSENNEATVDDTAPETVAVGIIFEIRAGVIHSLRTIETLVAHGLPPLASLEPGYQHAFDMIRITRTQIAPVAWALFTDWTTWNEWLYAENEQGEPLNKGVLLAEMAHQGRCVLMGSRAGHHHS